MAYLAFLVANGDGCASSAWGGTLFALNERIQRVKGPDNLQFSCASRSRDLLLTVLFCTVRGKNCQGL